MKPTINQQVFGKDTKPTIYYLTGYTTRIAQYKLHIYALLALDYRVVIFDYSSDILNSGEPQYLLNAMANLEQRINEDQVNHKVAGILGISLGSWIGLNLLSRCNINQGLFIAGGANIVHSIYDVPALAGIKRKFVANGYTADDLRRAWRTFDYTPNGSRFTHTRFALIASDDDEVIDSKDMRANMAGWQKTNPEIKLISYKHFRHTTMIVIALFHFRTLLKYLKKR